MANEPDFTITGNLTADPELRYTKDGTPVANFTIAATPRTYDRATQQWKDGETLFMPCTVWRDYAEHVTESLAKGMQVIATGTLRQRNWESQQGERRSRVEMTVDEVGPTLRWATAKVTRATTASSSQPGHQGMNSQPAGGSPGDPWGVSNSAGTFDAAPPF